MRVKSHTGREVLARITCLDSDAAELEASACEYLDGPRDAPHRVGFAHRLSVDGAVEYSFVAAAQQLGHRDADVARGLLAAVSDVNGRQALRHRGAGLLFQLALQARDFATAEDLLETGPLRTGVRQIGATDLVNPWLRSGYSENNWVASLNANVFGEPLVPVALQPDGDTPFDRLTVGVHTPVMHPSRITVIMSCFNPDNRLITAARSVLEQTWQNLELLVVDDASTSPTPGVLRKVEGLDPRIRVIRKAINGGTYRARNTALRIATGDYFTCVDSDDWAHPQFLEHGVRPLLDDPGLMATRGFGVRATPNMELNRVGYRGRIRAPSSLMVRTLPALNRVGFFDAVRKSADNEYANRLEACFGDTVVDLPDQPLLVIRGDSNSLSASDFSRGWRHPARVEYLESQQHFHQQVSTGARRAFVDLQGPRFFPAPRRWQRYPQDGEPAAALDVCVVADWRPSCVSERTVDYLERATDGGLAVGVVHLESLSDIRTELAPVAPFLRQLIADGLVERVYLDDQRQARTVVIADPRPFQFPGHVAVCLQTRHLQAVTDPEATAAGRYSATTVETNLTAMFGMPPLWSPLPALPAVRPPSRAPAVERTVLTVPPAGPCQASNGTVRSWPLREPADGARGALLSVVGTPALAEEAAGIEYLTDTWPDGPLRWAEAAVLWLAARPNAWCVLVRSAGTVHLVSRDGVRVVTAEPPESGPAKLLLEPADASARLTTIGVEHALIAE